MKFLLPLILVLATCWAERNPIYDDVLPRPFDSVEDDNYKLPREVLPTNYHIELIMQLDEKTGEYVYKGSSDILLDVQNETNKITFHAKNLNIDNKMTRVTYNDKEGEKDKEIEDIKTVSEDFVTLTLKEFIKPGMVLTLYLYYTGTLTDETHGFYKRSYVNERGKKRWLAATHFEPTSARRAFPCWDEPDIKTPFTIAITPPTTEYKVISNMAINGKLGFDNPDPVTGRTIFLETPDMPTYLVAFVVADYKRTNSKDQQYGIWTKPRESEKGDFAYDFGQDALKQMNKFTGIPYEKMHQVESLLMKMDQIAIPQFGPGAMENWGLVMYKESGLLYTEGKTTTENKQAIGTVISHEFSHQWFGNLVTCKWWNSIWLNEGFATFFQYYLTNKVNEIQNEDWNIMQQFVVKTLQASAFVADASNTSHALDLEKEQTLTPDQISNVFDDISYKKGACIIRMMQQFLGENIFKNGLNNYLVKNQFNSVTSDTLFEDIVKNQEDKVKRRLPRDQNLKDVMQNWVKAPGYPVVTISRKNDSMLNIRQKRFFLVESMNDLDETEWYIPLTYVTQASPIDEKMEWLIPGERLYIKHIEEEGWILFNKDQKGYYRVNYEEKNWGLLSEYLLKEISYKNISSTNRAQLIDDALNLARAGELKYDIALEVTKYLKNEVDYIPWYAAVRAFDYLDNLMQSSEQHALYQQYVTKRIETFAKTVNYTTPDKGDEHMQRLSQVLVLNTACKYGLKECEEFVGQKFKEWLERDETKEETLLVDYRKGVLCGGLRKADKATFEKILEKYKNSKDEDEKMDILAGLGCMTSEENINAFLISSLNSVFRIGIVEAMNSIYTGNGASFDSLIKFIDENLDTIKSSLSANDEFIRFLNKLATRVTNSNQLVELSILHAKLPYDVQNSKEFEGTHSAVNNFIWLKSHKEEVENWLKNLKEVDDQKADDNNSANSVTLSLFLIIVPVLFGRLY